MCRCGNYIYSKKSKKMIKNLKDPYTLLLFCITLGYFYYRYALSCNIYNNLQFDSQALLFWDYTSVSNLFAYKDIFYPYGLLFYFKNSSIFFNLLYFSIPSILFISLYAIFKNSIRSKLISFGAIMSIFLFVAFYTNHEVFVRYGSLTVLGMFYSLEMYKNIKLNIKQFLLEGILSGIIFSCIPDVGLYTIIIYFLLHLFHPFIKSSKKSLLNKYYLKLKQFGVFMTGFLLGIIPFLYYLISHDIVNDFFLSFQRLSYIVEYAKTPFPPNAASIENIFTFSLFLIVLFKLTLIFFIKKKKFKILEYIQISLLLVTILLEQKSIVRSLDKQLLFLGYLFFITLLIDFYTYIKKLKVTTSIKIGFGIVAFFIIFIGIKLKPVSGTFNPKRLYGLQCVDFNKKNLLESNNDYYSVVNYLFTKKDVNRFIYSFPSDPVFYILLKQKPPYYTNLYDGSSKFGQERIIRYLIENKVPYIVLNSSIVSTQDGVPDYIRGNTVLKYILTHYKVEKDIHNFKVLKYIGENGDFFTNIDKDLNTYARSLLTVDFENIPYSEGLYKENLLKKEQIIFHYNSNTDFQEYLLHHQLTTQNKIFAIKWVDKMNIKNAKISFTIEGNKSTLVLFNKCNGICILNLSNIPLFYINRRVTNIEIYPKNADITVYKQSTSQLW